MKMLLLQTCLCWHFPLHFHTLNQILKQSGHGVRAKRYASVAAASKASGVQVCNVVLRKRKGASPTRFWNAVGAVRKACRG